MKTLAVAVILACLASIANGQAVRHVKRPSGYGAAKGDVSDFTVPAVATGQLVSFDAGLLGGRKLLQQQRSLQGVDGDGTNVVIDPTKNVYSRVAKHCPTTNAPWAAYTTYPNQTEWAMYGDLVHDSYICDVSGAGMGKVVTSNNATGVFYGGAAQDFGSARPNWESYGWSMFSLQAPPAATLLTNVKVQGLSLHLIGTVGNAHKAGNTCKVKGVSVGIYTAGAAPNYNPNVLNYTKYIDLSGAGVQTFTWTANRTGVLYLDIQPEPSDYPILENNTTYWLRVKLHADYQGDNAVAPGGACFVFWGLSSQVKNAAGMKARWQEKAGGASGYSTTCVGAATSGGAPGATGTTVPDQDQTWWNCWNNGVNTATGNTGRRCSTYRNTVVPPIPSADCLSITRAGFNDYNYAFTGIHGQAGVSDGNGLGGAGGAK